MICRRENSNGLLVMDDFVATPVGENFVGADLAGDEHVLQVIDVVRYGWMYRHICWNVDDQYAGDFFEFLEPLSEMIAKAIDVEEGS